MLKLKDCYGAWHTYLQHFPKANRFTLGSKIDEVFLESIEYSFLASYSVNAEKLAPLNACIAKVDLLKLLLQLAWEIKTLDNKKYAHVSESLSEIGRMLGGWKRQILNKTPENISREKQ